MPLDRNHLVALADLVHGVVAAVGEITIDLPEPHVTLVAHSGLDADQTRLAVAPVVAATKPFTVHAHGYGFFTGTEPSELSLHVPVARVPALDRLHRRLCAALTRAGADVAAWSRPAMWSPHVTLLDRDLDPEGLGRAVAWLAGRHHPSWELPVDRISLVGSWADRDRPGQQVRFGS